MFDGFGRKITYLRLSVTELCNLRCRYCMPVDGVIKKSHESMLSEEEMITAVKAAASLGISKVRVTGGEPLVKKNIVSICSNIAKVEGIDLLCLTTNALLLPPMAESLKNAGVSRINMSLDTLDSKKYEYITRGGSLDDALKGLRAASDAGFEKIKVNAVLIGGFNDDEIEELAGLTLDYPVDMRFIELMPMTDRMGFGHEAYIPVSSVLEKLPGLKEEDGISTGVAKLYRLPGALGNVGLISPLSSHFCGSCNRIRITADGRIKPCLHKEAEYSIKGLDEGQMREMIRKAVNEKPEWHGELSDTHISCANRTMNRIGG